MRFLHPLVVVFALAPLAAHSEDEWIDEFPSVTTVAHAAAEELKITYANSPNLDVTDDDTVAVNLTGTFVVLREILALKHVEGPRLSAAEEDKFRRLVAAYQEAELTIGQGGPGRHGYIRSATGGIRCGDNEACYQRWFLQHLHSNTSRAEYRERFLKRLFPCSDLAQELNDLRQAHTVGMQYYPSPATTFAIEREVAGIGPAGCSAYGGDTDQDGLCNDWGLVPTQDASQQRAAGAADPEACEIHLTRVRVARLGGLKVAIAEGTATPGTDVAFRVTRAASPIGGSEQPVWEGTARVCERGVVALGCPSITLVTDPDWPLYVNIAGNADLTSGLASAAPAGSQPSPYLHVYATSVPSRGPVYCEQSLKTWLPRHLAPEPNGLHGPYNTFPAAAVENEPNQQALRLTDQRFNRDEYGFLILRKESTGKYYTTPPIESTQSVLDRVISLDQPTFPYEGYYMSFQGAFAGESCEEESEFVVHATVHTHPNAGFSLEVRDNFSLTDFDGAVELFLKGVNGAYDQAWGSGNLLRTQVRAIVMLNANADDLCVRVFTPTATAKTTMLLDDDEARWTAYAQDVRKVLCYRL